MKKVSVIVPVYNTSKYLRRCLDALTGQTLDEMEILLINDGSTDDSPKIMEEYCRKYPDKIRIINKENGGQATARNLGISEAKGEYIGFADSDDYVDRTLFEKLYSKAVETDADYVDCDYHCMYETAEGSREIGTRGTIKAHDSNSDMMLDPQVSPWNKLYRNVVLQKDGMRFPEGVIYEDTAFFMKTVPNIRKSAYVDEKLVYYCVRENSTMTANKSHKVADIFTVLQDIIDYYTKFGFAERYSKELEYFCVKIAFCSNLTRIGRVPDRKLRRELIGKTFDFVNSYFPKYRSNPYFGGKIGLYIKTLNPLEADLFAPIMGRLVKG